MSGECGACGAYFAGNWCQACGEGKPAGKGSKLSANEAAERANQLLADRRAYAESGPTSADLTDQQWFNVCKFFPKVAARCQRPMADLSPDNPMHKVRPGPLLQTMLGKNVVQRQPGEDDL